MYYYYRYWKRTPNLKVSDFRRDLDRHSIFSGRNILELRDASSFLNQEFCNRTATYFCHSYKHIVKKYLYCSEKIASVPFLGQVEVLEFDSSGKEYKSTHHDITISIPQGAIFQGETVHMEVAVALYGPFQFSDGKHPISPILWLCPQEDIVFQKPITIVLPHMLTDVCDKDVDSFGIQFAKADHQDYQVTSTGQKEYVFKPYEAEVVLQANDGKQYAKLKADHCCFWCLEMKKQNKVTPEVARQMAKKKGYFIHCVECLQSPYHSISPPRDVIHICVSFMLPTCMKVNQRYTCYCSNDSYHTIHSGYRGTVSPGKCPWKIDS